jgi:hypothetical protein
MNAIIGVEQWNRNSVSSPYILLGFMNTWLMLLLKVSVIITSLFL